jgi:predicted extracellular nuclease
MRRAFTPRPTAVARGAIALLAATALPAFASTSGIVISQVFGGNGNTYDSDYVELFNAGPNPVSLAGWSVQYASATGTGTFASNGPTALGGTLQPGQYWLVKLASSGTGATLPTPDAVGTTNISSSAGKLILANTATGLACNGGSTPCSPDQLAQIVDLVGYGSANFFEGTAAPALTSTTALLRGNHGCTDTDVNGSDLAVGTPAPRNSATAPAACDGGGGGATPAAIYQIQGNGAKSPLEGQLVATQGVVTRVNNNGFFMQDPVGDDDPSTSDGIFVYTGSAPTVQAGQLVSLTATVVEFNTGAATNADTAAHTVTELTGATNLQLLGTGTITPTVVAMPLDSEDAMEKYEGMLVTLQGPFTVQQNYFLGRYGELTLATGGRLQQPTNLYRPGADAQALNADNIRRTILLDDGSSVQNPNPTPYLAADNTVRGGDTVTELTGVIDYGLTTSSNLDPGAYKIHPVVVPTFSRDNPRTTGIGKIKGANVRVASANVLNFFTTLNDGTNTCPPSNTAADCRGANSQAEFDRQRTKIIEEFAGLDFDAIGLMELQNNGAVAVQNLADALNARLGTTAYAIVPDAPTGPGTDAIKVGIIYRTTKLKLIGTPMSDPAAINNRAPLAATFKVLNNSVKFTLIVNHLKSKGCDGATGLDLDQGDLQGCWNNQRVQQADELRSFAASVAAATGVADTLLVGDFNAYAQEDPIADLTGSGWIDQIGRYNGFGYSYVFNGTSGRLDHAFASASMSPKVMGAIEWHVNADEPSMLDYNLEFKQPACPTCEPDYYTPTPYRASDHDPLVLGLKMKKSVQHAANAPAVMGTPGDDEIVVAGARVLTGGGGSDSYVFNSLADAGGTITDFKPGEDDLDLRALLSTLGASPKTALARGVVHLQAAGNDTLVEVSPSGAPGTVRPLVKLANVTPDRIDPRRDLGLGHAKR